MDISQQVIEAKRLIKEIQLINANPDMHGRKLLYETCIQLDVVVQTMIARTANYAE